MADRMSDDEALAWVVAAPRTAKLATVRKDGSPHVVPIWVDLDEERRQLVFTVGEESLKYKALRRDPRVALCFDDERPPFTFVTVSGAVELSDDLDEMLTWATRIGGRYMGADQAEQYGRRNAVPGEHLVRLTPTRIVGVRGVAD
jgi:PPOX class probable F420-dependent enzyme